jgi:hypothetical protein
MMETQSSSETPVLTRPTRRNIPEVGILHSHHRENLKSYNIKTYLVEIWLEDMNWIRSSGNVLYGRDGTLNMGSDMQ